MADIEKARKALVARILEGNGHASRTERSAAFLNTGLEGPASRLADKVAKCSYKVTDQDIAAAKTAGFSEDRIFELVVCAAIGQATRQYDAGLAALMAASEEQ